MSNRFGYFSICPCCSTVGPFDFYGKVFNDVHMGGCHFQDTRVLPFSKEKLTYFSRFASVFPSVTPPYYPPSQWSSYHIPFKRHTSYLYRYKNSFDVNLGAESSTIGNPISNSSAIYNANTDNPNVERVWNIRSLSSHLQHDHRDVSITTSVSSGFKYQNDILQTTGNLINATGGLSINANWINENETGMYMFYFKSTVQNAQYLKLNIKESGFFLEQQPDETISGVNKNRTRSASIDLINKKLFTDEDIESISDRNNPNFPIYYPLGFTPSEASQSCQTQKDLKQELFIDFAIENGNEVIYCIYAPKDEVSINCNIGIYMVDQFNGSVLNAPANFSTKIEDLTIRRNRNNDANKYADIYDIALIEESEINQDQRIKVLYYLNNKPVDYYVQSDFLGVPPNAFETRLGVQPIYYDYQSQYLFSKDMSNTFPAPRYFGQSNTNISQFLTPSIYDPSYSTIVGGYSINDYSIRFFYPLGSAQYRIDELLNSDSSGDSIIDEWLADCCPPGSFPFLSYSASEQTKFGLALYPPQYLDVKFYISGIDRFLTTGNSDMFIASYNNIEFPEYDMFNGTQAWDLMSNTNGDVANEGGCSIDVLAYKFISPLNPCGETNCSFDITCGIYYTSMNYFNSINEAPIIPRFIVQPRYDPGFCFSHSLDRYPLFSKFNYSLLLDPINGSPSPSNVSVEHQIKRVTQFYAIYYGPYAFRSFQWQDDYQYIASVTTNVSDRLYHTNGKTYRTLIPLVPGGSEADRLNLTNPIHQSNNTDLFFKIKIEADIPYDYQGNIQIGSDQQIQELGYWYKYSVPLLPEMSNNNNNNNEFGEENNVAQFLPSLVYGNIIWADGKIDERKTFDDHCMAAIIELATTTGIGYSATRKVHIENYQQVFPDDQNQYFSGTFKYVPVYQEVNILEHNNQNTISEEIILDYAGNTSSPTDINRLHFLTNNVQGFNSANQILFAAWPFDDPNPNQRTNKGFDAEWPHTTDIDPVYWTDASYGEEIQTVSFYKKHEVIVKVGPEILERIEITKPNEVYYQRRYGTALENNPDPKPLNEFGQYDENWTGPTWPYSESFNMRFCGLSSIKSSSYTALNSGIDFVYFKRVWTHRTGLPIDDKRPYVGEPSGLFGDPIGWDMIALNRNGDIIWTLSDNRGGAEHIGSWSGTWNSKLHHPDVIASNDQFIYIHGFWMSDSGYRLEGDYCEPTVECGAWRISHDKQSITPLRISYLGDHNDERHGELSDFAFCHEIIPSIDSPLDPKFFRGEHLIKRGGGDFDNYPNRYDCVKHTNLVPYSPDKGLDIRSEEDEIFLAPPPDNYYDLVARKSNQGSETCQTGIIKIGSTYNENDYNPLVIDEVNPYGEVWVYKGYIENPPTPDNKYKMIYAGWVYGTGIDLESQTNLVSLQDNTTGSNFDYVNYTDLLSPYVLTNDNLTFLNGQDATYIKFKIELSGCNTGKKYYSNSITGWNDPINWPWIPCEE